VNRSSAWWGPYQAYPEHVPWHPDYVVVYSALSDGRREAHTVAADEDVPDARAMMLERLVTRALVVGERLGEGATLVHRDAYGVGEHIVVAVAGVVT
jgi:CBS domain-containing protein